MEKSKTSMIVSIIIFIAVIAILVFISLNKSKTVPADSHIGDAQGQDIQENNMPQNTQPSEATQGVKITTTKEGTGVPAKSGDTVAMNYTGVLADGTVFDSNVDPSFKHVEPFVFTIGAGQVIKGWDVGVAGMKVGEKRTLEIQPEYAYGATGAGGVIPPNATLRFDVELVAIKS